LRIPTFIPGESLHHVLQDQQLRKPLRTTSVYAPVTILFMVTMEMFLPRLRRDIDLKESFSVAEGVAVDIGRWRSAPKRRVAGGGNLSGGAAPFALLLHTQILMDVGFRGGPKIL
jgi:hypothetical protein